MTLPGTSLLILGSLASACTIADRNFHTPPDALGAATLTIEAAGSGVGDVSSSPAGIECGTTCMNEFPGGTVVTLNATAAEGSTFMGWSGACSGRGDCAVTMDGDKSVGATFSLSGEKLWLKHVGGLELETATAVAIDNDRNVAVVGAFRGSITIDGVTLTATGGMSDVLAMKLDGSNGSLIWVKQFGASDNDTASDIALDEAGNVFVVGEFGGAVDFGSTQLISAGAVDAFVSKLAPLDGSVIWARRFGGIGQDRANAVAVDSSGHAFVLGDFSGVASFDGLASTSLGGEDVFLIKCDSSDGHRLWLKPFGGTSSETSYSVAVDGSDNVMITGNFSGTAAFGGSQFTSAGSGDIFLGKYAGVDGSHIWSQRVGGSNGDNGIAVVADSNNAVALTGFFSGTVDFGGGSSLTSNGGTPDAFVAKYSTSGAHVWSRGFGGANNDTGIGITTDGADEIYAVGWFRGTADFGGGPVSSALDTFDIYAARYSADNTHLWSTRWGGTGSDTPNDVAVGDGVSVVVGGFYGFTEIAGEELTSNGGDLFVLAIVP